MFINKLYREEGFGQNAEFGNITGDAFFGDNSFLLTLRAILHGRVPANECVALKFVEGEKHDDSVQLPAIEPGTLTVWHAGRYASTAQTNAFIAYAEAKLNADPMFREDTVVRAFFHNYKVRPDGMFVPFEVRLFINDTLKSAVVVATQLNYKRIHVLQAAAIRAFPWYMSAPPAVTAPEYQLIKKLAYPNKYGASEYATELDNLYQLKEQHSAVDWRIENHWLMVHADQAPV